MSPIRVDCEACGYHLGWLAIENGAVVNLDLRLQPKPPTDPRIRRDDEWLNWRSACKCGATDIVREERLINALKAVDAAGLTHMPFRGIG